MKKKEVRIKESLDISEDKESVKKGIEALKIKLEKEQAEINRYNLTSSGPFKVFPEDGK